MLTSVITFLIYLCIFAIVIYLVIYVLGVIGVPIPPKVLQLIWVIVALIAVLWLVQMVTSGGSFKLGNPFRLGDAAIAAGGTVQSQHLQGLLDG